ncbi:MAG: hypothetical protein GC159_23045 [Phycisphaera sp.]|nr:hypothetical protein [Phycisphaera sp.]
MSTGMDLLFERYALGVMDKQRRLASIVGDDVGRLDLDGGVVRFDGAGVALPMQWVGSESSNGETWVWAWAQHDPGVPTRLLRAAETLHRHGQRHRVAELIAAELPLADVDTQRLAVVATGVVGASAHCRCVRPHGAAHTLLVDATIDAQPGFTAVTFATDLADLIGRCPFNHRHAIDAYLAARRVTPRVGGGDPHAGECVFQLAPGDDEVRLVYGGDDRVTDMYCQPPGACRELIGAASGRPWWKFW